jgi:hypothetical protein
MLSLYYRKRAIPLVWMVLPKMGNSSFTAQVELLSHLNDLMLPGVTVVLLGDREFGTPDRVLASTRVMVRTIGCYDCDYCLRVKGSACIYPIGECGRRLGTMHFSSRRRMGHCQSVAYRRGSQCWRTMSGCRMSLCTHCATVLPRT